ncbi:MAG: Asp-tRNA(Asn)/Glu-tRNA(Gln) amidotransferase subunit GatC [Streptococcaceae bacterium]|jgi:aspartyl-tRNA(Asn)/glutamyl-tRNA(Gln) amidotransferase subunit C|nr:Asp-tRNA(Asn)/Glu-tRNA(Gln) amidotransferase subunit GatC [Streptococcaceae bacterium]
MTISEEKIKHVAKLAKLEFLQEELYQFTKTFGKIIDMVKLLNEVDTTNIPFTSHVVDSINVLRRDVAIPGMDRKELMKNVPAEENGFIKVPAILDEGKA